MLVRHAARTLLVALLVALLVPVAALALGLGDIHLKSALNAPLDAQIDLVGASTDDLETLKATLASPADFERYGLDYPSFLGTVTLQPQHLIDGRNVIQVNSSNPATEPFASLLVQIDWAHGHLVRQYTVLIDPPVLTGNQGNTTVAAPTAGGTALSGAVQRAPAAAPAPESGSAADQGTAGGEGAAASGATGAAAPSSAAPGSSPAAAGGIYTVHSGDTLFAVAASAYGAGDRSLRQRQMVAIYRANPQAFNGNVNELLAGRQLTLPGEADVAAISPAAAATELRQQTERWKSGAGATGTAAAAGGRLRLVPPSQGAEGGAATGAGAATGTGGEAALRQQVQDLTNQLAQSKRLLAARSAELAALQARVAGPSAAAAAASSQAAHEAPAGAQPPAQSETSPQTAPPAPSEAPAAAAPVVAAAPAAKPAAKPGPARAATARTAPAAGEGVLGLLTDYWYVLAAAVVALILLLVLRKVRARQEEAFDRSLDRLGSMTLDVPNPTPRTETVPLRALGTARKEQSFLVEESGSREQPDFSTLATTGQHVAIDDSVTGEAPVALDQGDPLAEADFHMAYGLYDQAADLVQIALSREPNRRDLKLKLLEVFFVWGNRDRFLQTARELAASRNEALPGEWEKTVIMGRQIAPDDPLFSGAGSVQGAASAGVDLNLEGGQNRVDFDLLGEPQVSPAHGESGVDLDLGAALGAGLGEGDPTGEALRLNDGVDFVLDDPERGNELTGSTREMPGEPESSGNTATVQTEFGRDADAPTVEQPQLHEADSTIREKLDAPTRIGLLGSTGDQTAELALDDLGLDLGALGEADDTPAQAAGEDQATLLAGMDDHARRVMARAEAARNERSELIFDDQSEDAAAPAGGRTQAAPTPAGVGPTATGTWLFSDQDFSEIVGDHTRAGGDAPTELVTMITPPSPDASPTSRLTTLSTHDLDLDLGSLAAEGATPIGSALDLDVGPDTTLGADDATGEVQKIGDDLTLPDLEPVTLSEVGTKLDLARAYMDMGDPDGARSILQEVLAEGSGSQKQEARRLIDALPG